MKKAFGLLFCLFNIHDWEIYKWSRFKDIKCKHLSEEGFDRRCIKCEEWQTLQRPKEYHPSKYIWGKRIK